MKPTLIHNKKEKTAELLIYGPIGKSFWDDSGVSAEDVTEALNEIPKGTQITIGINSQGGSIGEGLAIHNAIARRASEVTARIDGYALSAGSFIPLAASKVVSPDSAIWMIHKGWMMTQGNADEHRKAAELLDVHDEAIISIYEKKTGKSLSEIEIALSAETWFTGAEAVEWGLADESEGDVQKDAMDKIDLLQAPAGTFRDIPAFALAGKAGDQVSKGAHVFAAHSDAKPADTLQTTSTVLAAARQQTTERNPNMDPVETPAQAATPQPAPVDFTPVIEAINALADRIKPTVEEPAGAAPIGIGRVENLGNPTIEAYEALVGNKRKIHASNNFDAIREARRSVMPRMANTLDADLIVDSLAGGAISTLTAKVGALTQFASNFPIGAVKRGDLQVTVVSGAATGSQNPTNFESGNSTTTNAAVPVNHESLSFHVSNNDLESGLQLQKLAKKNAAAYAVQLSDIVTALMLTATYGTTNIGAAASFAASGLGPIRAVVKNGSQKFLLLDGSHYSMIMSSDREKYSVNELAGGFGFDMIAEHNSWTSATVATGSVVGFVCAPEAIAVAGGRPAELPAQEFISIDTIDIGGLAVTVPMWYSRGTRALWCSFDAMWGAINADASAADVLSNS